MTSKKSYSREYPTPDGYIRAVTQLEARGFNVFIRVHRPRARTSKLIASKIALPAPRIH